LPAISTNGLTSSDVSYLCETIRNDMTNILESYNNSKINDPKVIRLQKSVQISLNNEKLTMISREL